jgi:hypothetical protein
MMGTGHLVSMNQEESRRREYFWQLSAEVTPFEQESLQRSRREKEITGVAGEATGNI